MGLVIILFLPINSFMDTPSITLLKAKALGLAISLKSTPKINICACVCAADDALSNQKPSF